MSGCEWLPADQGLGRTNDDPGQVTCCTFSPNRVEKGLGRVDRSRYVGSSPNEMILEMNLPCRVDIFGNGEDLGESLLHLLPITVAYSHIVPLTELNNQYALIASSLGSDIAPGRRSTIKGE